MESLYRRCDCNATQATCVSPPAPPEFRASCFKFGPFCAAQNVLDVFAPAVAMFAPPAAYADHVAELTDEMVLHDFNSWNNVHQQKHGCYDMDGTIQTADMLAAGEEAYAHHCVCDEANPTDHDGVSGFCTPDTCEAGIGSDQSEVQGASSFKKRIWMAGCSSCGCDSWDASHPDAQAASSPFNTERFDVSKVAGGLVGTAGQYTKAKALFGFYALDKNSVFTQKDGREMDPVNDEWEKAALCRMGIAGPGGSKGGGGNKQGSGTKTGSGLGDGTGCTGNSKLKFTALFGRSFGDAFGKAILGDLAALISAYYLMAAYLFVMLSRYDPVHSMIGMSCVALMICGMSFTSCIGMGGYLGIYDNNLNTNIPFLLLGLGIDDAFVLTSEFTRATTILGDGASLEDRTAMAMKGGAISI
eukprot:COSAG02_NODE_10834_length_1849_cov_1.294857_2_plen_414_part_01